MVLLFRKYPLKKKQFKFTFNFGFKIYAKLLLQEYFHFSINLKFFFLTNKQLSNECSSSQSICQQKYFLFLTLSLLFFFNINCWWYLTYLDQNSWKSFLYGITITVNEWQPNRNFIKPFHLCLQHCKTG